MGRNLHPNNYVAKDKAAQIRNLPFDEWIDMFHLTLVLYNEFIGLGNKIHLHYAGIASANSDQIEVLVPSASGALQPTTIVYRPEFQDFRYKQSNE